MISQMNSPTWGLSPCQDMICIADPSPIQMLDSHITCKNILQQLSTDKSLLPYPLITNSHVISMLLQCCGLKSWILVDRWMSTCLHWSQILFIQELVTRSWYIIGISVNLPWIPHSNFKASTIVWMSMEAVSLMSCQCQIKVVSCESDCSWYKSGMFSPPYQKGPCTRAREIIQTIPALDNPSASFWLHDAITLFGCESCDC